MNADKLKKEISVVKKKNIYYLVDKNGKMKKYKPWLGDISSFLYDKIMERSVFPKKFNGDINKHFQILKNELGNIRNNNVLEIATGSGNAAYFLNNDNSYTGIDVSSGLLRKASLRLKEYGFKDVKLYNVSAEELPFSDSSFDFAICNLSLNFFSNIELFIQEINRVLKFGSTFICSVPVPERKLQNSKINGTLYSEKELISLFEKYNFNFKNLQYKNGALLYFSATLNNKTKVG